MLPPALQEALEVLLACRRWLSPAGFQYIFFFSHFFINPIFSERARMIFSPFL